jgi:UDP-N-acetyl-D-mannosaminuronate dehydrogenase
MNYEKNVMTDIILGMGEVGSTLFDLLSERGINCIGIDIDKSKCKNYSENTSIVKSEYLHICLPGELDKFLDITEQWINKINSLQCVIIHSTVKPGTTKKIQDKFDLPILFSPIRGVHRRFLNDVKKYTKFVSSDNVNVDSKIKNDLKKRFQKIQWMSSTKTAELAKILVDTTYYGWLINYAQITKIICDKEKIDFDEMWKFADEIHEYLGNRPKMFPGVIGGHCVIPNLNLIEYDNLEIIRKINDLYKNYYKVQI